VAIQVGTHEGIFPFDLPVYGCLADTAENLAQRLPAVLRERLARFNVLG